MVNIVDIKRGQQLYSIDFTKFIMAIFVIAIHTHPLEPVTNKFILNFYNELVGLAVPFFFITNGYLLFKNKDIKSSSEMIATVKKFAIKMAKLYIMWSAIYLPLAIYDYISQGRSVIKSVVTYIGKLVLVGDHYLSWPLWYLLSAIYAAVVLYFVIYKFGLNKKILLGSAVMFFGLDIFLTYIVNNQANLKWGGVILLSKIVQKTIQNGRILQGQYYIPIGILLATIKKKKFFNRVIATFGFVLTFIISAITNVNLLSLMCKIFFFVLVISFEIKYSEIFYYLRRSSTVMYFTHMLFYAMWISLNVPQYGFGAFVWTFILSILISIIVIFLEKISIARKCIKILFG